MDINIIYYSLIILIILYSLPWAVLLIKYRKSNTAQKWKSVLIGFLVTLFINILVTCIIIKIGDILSNQIRGDRLSHTISYLMLAFGLPIPISIIGTLITNYKLKQVITPTTSINMDILDQ